jgi:hypothetical protein
VQQRLDLTRVVPKIVTLQFSSGIQVSIAEPTEKAEGLVQFKPSGVFNLLLYNR